MDRFVKGLNKIVCYHQDDVNELLDIIASNYPQVKWRDSGAIHNFTPGPPDPLRGLTFMCEKGRLVVSRSGLYRDALRLHEVLEPQETQAIDGNELIGVLLG